MAKAGTPEQRDAVVCPYCGLFCDDLSVAISRDRIEVLRKGCAVAKQFYAAIEPPMPPRVDGGETTFEAAYARTAEILAAGRFPLVAGLGCDLAGAKAAVALAESVGAVIDHAASDAMFRNILPVQDKGWMATTFAEIKNRADLVILAGTDAVSRFPRFFERLIWNTETLFGPKRPPDIVYLGSGFDTRAGHSPDGKAPTVIDCDTRRLAELFQGLRAIHRGRAFQASEVADAAVASLSALVQKIKDAKYGALVWAVADMEGAHGDLAVQAMCDLVSDINETSRFACLPLGGTENALGAQQVCTWQAGFPLRTSFAGGVASYDPYRNSWRHLLESGEADAVLWISAFKGGSLPFETKIPTIVLAAPGTACAREPEVFIPVGTPGIDHAGHVIRSDAVTSLPLHQLRASELPQAADALRAIDIRVARKEGS